MGDKKKDSDPNEKKHPMLFEFEEGTTKLTSIPDCIAELLSTINYWQSTSYELVSVDIWGRGHAKQRIAGAKDWMKQCNIHQKNIMAVTLLKGDRTKLLTKEVTL